VYVVEFEKWFDDLRAEMLADPVRTLRRLENPQLPCLEIRPARPLAYSLFRMAERLRDPRTDAAPREENAALRESRLVNQAWTVLRLERMLRQVDEVSRLLAFKPPVSPVLFESALREPEEPLHLLDGGLYGTGGHRSLAGELAALRAFVRREAADYGDPGTPMWEYERLVRFRDTVDAIVHGKKIPDGGYTSPSYGINPRTYPELVTDRFEGAARSLALRNWAAYLEG
jgi:hypothetical protein